MIYFMVRIYFIDIKWLQIYKAEFFLISNFFASHLCRLLYLAACFWSVYAEMPHVVAAVKNEKDAHYAMYVLRTTVLTVSIFISLIFSYVSFLNLFILLF